MSLVGQALRSGYGGCAVLGGVDFALEAGRLVCVLGPNGAGKSTLARALVGLLGPGVGGRVSVDGEALDAMSPRSRAQRIGFLPQEVEPGFRFRVEEAVALGARVAAPVDAEGADRGTDGGAPRAGAMQTADAIEAALDAVDALHLRGRALDALSGGERRRVLLASVLAQRPRYLVLDEPTAMLDLEHQVGLFARLRAHTAAGLGVLVVTHDLNLAARQADELLLMHRGSVHAQGTPSEVLVAPVLEEVFGPCFELLEDAAGRPVVVPR